MYCTKCGKQISDDSQFCCYCGARQTPIVNNNTPINTANKKTKIKIPLKNKKIRRLRNAISRINTAFFVVQKQITPHWIWYNRVD